VSINFAIDALYDGGWSTLDFTGCGTAPDGRVYPGLSRVRTEFARLGYDLAIRKVEEFDCFRAEWSRPGSPAEGSVVGQSETEAAVYALAQARRALTHAPA